VQSGKDFFDLSLGGAEWWHDDDHVADRPRKYATLGQDVADAGPGLFSQFKRFACLPVANQFHRQHAPRLPDVADLRQAPKPLGFGAKVLSKLF
ncbi:uncharacterized protein METZ01_LOCUS201803, partial [marine metagenome]